jgi:hypothetical protein
MLKLGGANNITAAIRRHTRDATRAPATSAGPLLSLYRPLEVVLGFNCTAASGDLGEVHRGMPFLLCFLGRGNFMTEHAHDTRQPPAAAPIPESAARRIAEERRAEAELVMVTDLLSEVPELRQDPSAKVSGYIDGLVKRRAELLNQVGSATATRVRAQPADSLVARLGPFFTPWVAVNLPYFAESIYDRPSQSGTQGDIETDSLDPGGVEFEMSPLVDAGTVEPNIPKWWTHTWWCSYVFPPPLTDSRLFYRFTTVTSFDLEIGSARPQTGSLINAWAAVGTTPDVEAATPFDAPLQSAFAFSIPLPVPQANLPVEIENQPTNFSGSVEVQAGRNAAIGFLYGVAAGIATGTVLSFGGTMSTCLTLPPGTQSPGDPCDKIEYRFEPAWWVQAVNQRRQEAAGS